VTDLQIVSFLDASRPRTASDMGRVWCGAMNVPRHYMQWSPTRTR
jgi:hypothetical protein